MPLNAASEKRLAGVKPALVKVVRRAAEISKQPFQIVQGARTLAQQKAIYAQGRTKPGPIVTWTMNSKHIGGNAVDFSAWVNGKHSWNDRLFPAIARAFKQAAAELNTPIIWGGDWKRKDWGHIQLAPKTAPTATKAPAMVSDKPEPAKLAVEPKSSPTADVPVSAPAKYDPQRAVSFFVGRGWSEVAACALVASLMWESGGNGKWTIVWDAKGDKKGEVYTSRYAAQWNGSRIAKYEAFASSIGRSVLDPYAQLAYVHHELTKIDPTGGKKLATLTTIEEANDFVIKRLWNPSIPHADRRLAIAKKLLAA